MKKISEEETKKRFQKLKNLEVLHAKQKEKNEELRQKLKIQKIKEIDLEKENKIKDKTIELQKLRIEELEAMKFGKRRRNKKNLAIITPSDNNNKKPAKRPPKSYRRPEPKETEITDELQMEIENCRECGEKLCDKKDHIHYREDLKKTEERLKEIKRMIRVTVENGICKNMDCKLFGKKVSAMEIPKQKVIIGENLRQMIVYLTVIMGQSYSEVGKNLKALYDVKISSGHISKILEGESNLLSPYYNYLIETLEKESKGKGVHYDETTWKTQSQGKEISDGNYCWIKTSIETNNQIIWFGQSRGKMVAERLRGDKKDSKGVSDNYGAYKNLFDHHQLCWAHPHRKLRDLAESDKLQGKAKRICQKTFKDFAKVYKKARKLREEILSNSLINKQKKKRIKQVKNLFKNLFEKNINDPDKLKSIRESLKRDFEKYFTFLEHQFLPLDNNKAERAIRKVVIRRKKTMGSKSPKGADVLSILYSVIFSITENNPDKNFFELYNEAAEFCE